MHYMLKRFSTLGSKLLIAFTALSVTTMTADKSTADLIDGLTNYWSMDDSLADEASGLAGSASTVDDQLIPSDVAAFGTTMEFSDTSMFGQAIEMTGGEADGHLFADPSDDVLGVPGVGGYLDGNMTISVWAQATSFESNWQAIVAHGEDEGYRLHRRGSDNIAAFTGNSSGDTDPAGPGTDISPGTGWHHFVALVNNNVAELWVDGQFQGSESEGTPEDQGNGVHIGFNPDTSGREWRGQIDDVAMWNRAVSSSEIFEIYSNGLSGCSLLDDTCGVEPFLPFSLPGPTGSNGEWGVREVTNNGPIDSLQAATDSLLSGGGTTTDGQFATLDVTDPDTNVDGGPILTSTPHNFLSNTGADDDDITTVAKGRIKVEQGGDYTFQVNSNDGSGLRIVGKDFTSASNGGIIDPKDPTTVARFTAGTALGVVNLEPGEYDVEFVSWENTGEGFYELTSAQGAITNPNLAQWIAVGDSSSLPGFPKPPAVLLSEPAAVFNMGGVPEPTEPGSDDGGVGAARAEFLAGNITGADDTEIIALHDPESGNNLGGTSTPFPAQVDGQDDNDFTTAVLGQIVVDDGDGVPDEQIALSFSLQSDDNGQIHIIGSSFETSNQPLVDIEGDLACTGDFNSGNINTTCTITLEEGTHSFEAYHREQGGGAYFQVWWAEGTKTGFSDSEFTILSTDDTPTDIPANTGLALVSDVVEPWPGDITGDGHTDSADLNILGINWQMSGKTRAEGDLTGDGIVNSADLNEIGRNWQTWRDGMPAAVPEPSSIALLLAGLLAACGCLRKHRW